MTSLILAPLVVHEGVLAERKDLKDSQARLLGTAILARQFVGVASLR